MQVTAPLPLDITELRRDLPFWSQVDVIETTGSTNADLLAVANADPDADRRVLIAEHQVAGRGRHARTWVSPPRAQLAVSVLLRLPGIDSSALGWLPALAGIAVADMLTDTAKVNAELKWPNDVLIDGRKVAGILAEVGTPRAGDNAPTVVVGIGLNVSLAEDELPVPHATSLTLEGAQVTNRTVLANALLVEFARRFDRWRESNWAPGELATVYRDRCVTIGKQVRAELPGDRALVGTATGVDGTGRLLIRTDSGEYPVSAADVTHLRPQTPS